MPEEELKPLPEEAGEEDESDVAPLSDSSVRQAFVTGSDWTSETLLNQLRRGNIDLNPRFQRREVWRAKRKSEFIESIFLNLPIPQIVLAERRDEPGTYLVLDGKQRLLALRQFCSQPDTFAEDKEFEPLRLSALTARRDLNRKTYAELKSVDAPAAVNAFDNHTIRTVVIRNWPDDDFLYRVFLRLNTGSVQLSPQELRQALIPGPFVDYADDFAINSVPLQQALGISGPDFRMRDTELLVRFYAFSIYLAEYRGNLKAFLDSTCNRLNETWEGDPDAIRGRARACERAIETTVEIFGQREAFTVWREPNFEGRFNRAVFDIMTYSFSRPAVATAAIRHAPAVRDAFISLCKRDRAFLAALTSTTKSLDATIKRFSAWSTALSKAAAIPSAAISRDQLPTKRA